MQQPISDVLFASKVLHIDADHYKTLHARYEDNYGMYLSLFHDVAYASPDTQVVVHHAPSVWVPLLCYWGCLVADHTQPEYPADDPLYENCPLMDGLLRSMRRDYKRGHDTGTQAFRLPSIDGVFWRYKFTRTQVETLCGLRPETVDALWKGDAQWCTPVTTINEGKRDFIITTNGSFWRHEVQHYIKSELANYQPSKEVMVMVPCAADKPYPAKMHEDVKRVLPACAYLANATGVLGIVPEDLWGVMPYYDSGVPNEWRLQCAVNDYFQTRAPRTLIVYCDFYSLAIRNGLLLSGYIQRPDIRLPNGHTVAVFLDAIGRVAYFVNPIKFYADYVPLEEGTDAYRNLTQLLEVLFNGEEGDDSDDELPHKPQKAPETKAARTVSLVSVRNLSDFAEQEHNPTN